jgi:hypothetical protein
VGFERATGQALVISAVLLAFASAASASAAAAVGPVRVWLALAIILQAVSTALVAYMALYAFGQQSQIYGDVVRAMRATSHLTPGSGIDREGEPSNADIAGLVRRLEDVLRQEHARWGQLNHRN